MIFCVLQKSKSLKVVFVASDFSQESKQGVINHHTHKINKVPDKKIFELDLKEKIPALNLFNILIL